MPGKHAAPQTRAPRTLLSSSSTASVGAHRAHVANVDRGRVARSTSLAALGLTGTLALTLGGVAVGDEDRSPSGPEDVALAPETGSGFSVGSLAPLRQVSQVATLASASVAPFDLDTVETEDREVAYRPRHRAEPTPAPDRDQPRPTGTTPGDTSGDTTSTAADQPGTTRTTTDSVVGTTRRVADRAPEQTDPVVDPLVDAADVADGLLP